MDAEFDLFLSYRWADKATVAPLVAALEARGISVWQDARGENARAVEDLASIQQAVTHGIANSRALLAWYSLAYNASRACQWELTAAYLAGQTEGDARRRVLVVNPEASAAHVHLPELLDQLHLSGAGVPHDAAAVDALAQRLQAALGRQVPAKPIGAVGSLLGPRWLPHMASGSSRFVGRLREMWQLHGALQAGQAAMLTGSGGKPNLAQVRGAGGIGKSLLAEEYALRFGAAYPGGVFWLRAYGYTDSEREISPDERSALREGQQFEFASRLGLAVQGLSAAELQGLLSRHLAQAGQPFLWVVDDLPAELGSEGLQPWLAPHALGCTLITTRARRFNHVVAIELPLLDEEDALRLLARGKPLASADEPAARDICRQLGHHALAIDVAAALVQRRGYAAFLKSLQREDRDALELAATGFSEALPNGHERSIAATLLSSMRELGDTPRDLLRLAAMLAAAPIPRELLWRTLAHADELEDDEAEDRCDAATDSLLTSSLADEAEDSAGGPIIVHTLVARAQRFQTAQVKRVDTLRASLVATLAKRMQLAGDIREHKALADWVNHARELGRAPQSAEEALLTSWVAVHDDKAGQYRSAALGFQLAHETLSQLLGEEHPDTLNAMDNLATALQHRGELSAARAWQERVLEARLRVLGEEHPDTLAAMNNLASTLSDQGELSTARAWQERVLEAHLRVQGEEHSVTLTAMNNLASTLSDQGELSAARAWQERVLEARLRVLGEEHPDTLTAMNNLAISLWEQGDSALALQYQSEAVEGLNRVLESSHPTTLQATSTLLEMRKQSGRDAA
jgi:hypothetical protein